MTGISQAEFARRQGWAKSYVTKLKREGRLVLGPDGGVDVEASRALIAATAASTRPDAAARAAALRAGGGAWTAGAPYTGPVHPVNAPAPGHPADPITPALPPGEGARLRRVREVMTRELKLIELGLARGELLERDAVDRAWAALGTTLRASMETGVERLAPVLGAAPDRAHLAALVHADLRAALRRFDRALIATARAAQRSPA